MPDIVESRRQPPLVILLNFCYYFHFFKTYFLIIPSLSYARLLYRDEKNLDEIPYEVNRSL